jgi:DOPA 4,5-dioxygenase
MVAERTDDRTSQARIESWHSHVYFDAQTREAAWALRETIMRDFAGCMEMGRFHERPVGPHPMGSYQIAFAPEQFSAIVPWLALNRGALIVFTHPNTGDDLGDHRDRAIWMGATMALDLSVLE